MQRFLLFLGLAKPSPYGLFAGLLMVLGLLSLAGSPANLVYAVGLVWMGVVTRLLWGIRQALRNDPAPVLARPRLRRVKPLEAAEGR